MSRARNIKPGFFKNEDLAECEPLARLLFAGLWCEADREGRLEDRPKKLKGVILPYDNCDADDLLAQLQRHGFIKRYAVANLRLIEVSEFKKHQSPHFKEVASTFPAPDQPEAFGSLNTNEAPGKPEALVPFNDAEASDNPDASLVQTPVQHPLDSLIPDCLEKEPPNPRKRGKVDTTSLTLFERFWASYPRKIAKPAALKAWAKIDTNPETIAAMRAGLARWKASRDWAKDEGEYIPHPATWLNGSRWNDHPLPVAVSNSTATPINGHASVLTDEERANTRAALEQFQ